MFDHEEISGANAQEIAAPAETETVSEQTTHQNGGEVSGENEQAVAEPAESVGDETNVDGSANEAQSERQTSEENARYAAARRKAERDARAEIDRVRAEEARRADELIAGLGFTNPETGARVTNRAEYEAMQTAVRQQRERELAKRAGMTDEEWKALVEASPMVKEAREQQRRSEEEQQAARAEKIKGQLREELAEITKIDPAIKNFEDLRADGKWSDMESRIKRGYGLLDSYKLAHMDDLADRRAAAARQSAMNSAAQKQHMQTTEQQGSGGVTVPASVKNMYRSLNPKATDADIERHYAKYLKTQK